MSESKLKPSIPSTPGSPRTLLGRAIVAHGELSSDEDMVIDGQFDGSISAPNHCLTIGTEANIKAGVLARHVIVQGSVVGNLTASEKIEVRGTGRVVGDLVAATVVIEDGAYFKGSIDIARDDGSEAARGTAAQNIVRTPA